MGQDRPGLHTEEGTRVTPCSHTPCGDPKGDRKKEAPGGRVRGPKRGCQEETWGSHPMSTHPTLPRKARGGGGSREGQCGPSQGHLRAGPGRTQAARQPPVPCPRQAYAPGTGVSHHPAIRESGPARVLAGARGPAARPAPAEAHGCPGSRPRGAGPAPAGGSPGSTARTSPGGLGPLGMEDRLLRGPPTGRPGTNPKKRSCLEGTIRTHKVRGIGLMGLGLVRPAWLCPSRRRGRGQGP